MKNRMKAGILLLLTPTLSSALTIYTPFYDTYCEASPGTKQETSGSFRLKSHRGRLQVSNPARPHNQPRA